MFLYCLFMYNMFRWERMEIIIFMENWRRQWLKPQNTTTNTNGHTIRTVESLLSKPVSPTEVKTNVAPMFLSITLTKKYVLVLFVCLLLCKIFLKFVWKIRFQGQRQRLCFLYANCAIQNIFHCWNLEECAAFMAYICLFSKRKIVQISLLCLLPFALCQWTTVIHKVLTIRVRFLDLFVYFPLQSNMTKSLQRLCEAVRCHSKAI